MSAPQVAQALLVAVILVLAVRYVRALATGGPVSAREALLALACAVAALAVSAVDPS